MLLEMLKTNREKAIEYHCKMAGLEKHTSKKEHPKILMAKDAELNTAYLVVGIYYSIVIRRINKIEGTNFITSVSIRSEIEPMNNSAVISGDTPLIAFSEEWHFYKKTVKESKKEAKESRKEAKEKKIKEHAEKGPSKSSFIDPYIFKLSKEVKPDLKAVAKQIIASGVLPNDTEKTILGLVHVRYWHYKNGKIGEDKK